MSWKRIFFMLMLVSNVSYVCCSFSDKSDASGRKACSFNCFAAMLQRRGETSKQERSMLLRPQVKQYVGCSSCHSRQMKFRMVPIVGPHFFALPAKAK